jgi:uncharacterized surface protein with fasciclin (FAS1) repeats
LDFTRSTGAGFFLPCGSAHVEKATVITADVAAGDGAIHATDIMMIPK